VIIGREFAVTGLRSLAYARGISMPASPLGKTKMVAQVIAILALILSEQYFPGLFVVGQAMLWVVVVTALASAWGYFRQSGFLLGPRVADLPVEHRERIDRRAS
jgi:CDP-diacylglycerol--glycerol-3-phosphate 3-phosphatidyltransferase